MAGHVEKRGPRRYVAVWKDPITGRRRAKSFDRKIDAENHLTRTGSAILDGAYVSPDAGKITLGEYAVGWVDRRHAMQLIGVTTRDRYRREAGYLESIAAMPLSRVTPHVLEQWQAHLLAIPLNPSTVATVRAGLSAILRSAVRDRLIPSNPLADVGKAKMPSRKVTPLSVDVVESIRDTIAPWYSAAVMLGAGCGMRRGETFGLTVDRVDFLRRTIRVDRQLIRTAERGLLFGRPKTESSIRDIPAPDAVLDALAAHMARFPPVDGLIFTTRGGKPVDAGILADAFRRVAPPGARFHDLRHFYASALIAAGADVIEVQHRLGHATATETLNTYGHLWPGAEDTTRRRMNDVFARRGESNAAMGEQQQSNTRSF